MWKIKAPAQRKAKKNTSSYQTTSAIAANKFRLLRGIPRLPLPVAPPYSTISRHNLAVTAGNCGVRRCLLRDHPENICLTASYFHDDLFGYRPNVLNRGRGSRGTRRVSQSDPSSLSFGRAFLGHGGPDAGDNGFNQFNEF